MAERRASATDGLGWLLLFCGLVVALCVLSHEPQDASVPNLLGAPGHLLAAELYAALGSAVYVLLAAWFVLVLMLLVGKGWLRWTRRFLGWLLLLPVTAIAADWLGADWLPGPIFGSGGAVGAALRALLHDKLPGLPGILTFAVVAFLGVFLAADFAVSGALNALYWICFALSFVVALVARALGAVWRFVTTRRPATEKPQAVPKIDVPIQHTGFEVKPEPIVDAEIEPQAEQPAILPITRLGMANLPEENFDNYELPPMSLLEDPEPFPFEQHDQKLRDQAAILEQTFRDFDLNVKVVGINTGPVITQYEVSLETGLRVNKITTLGDDLALHLKVPSVRIVAPIPGKNAVGIEVPNEHRATVRLKEVILGAARRLAKCKVPLFLGKDAEGKPLAHDLADMPHLLIAGTTGTGKSVCLNALIISMLMTRRPDELKMLLIDPKKNEFSDYRKIPHLMHPVITDETKATAVLAWAVDKMEERYDLLSRARVRNLAQYNELGMEAILNRVQPDEEERERIPEKMPFIVIVIDEFGDLIMQTKREAETYIIRLAQKARAAGIHLVLATQRPTVDIVTGLIKSNLPGRICFKVASRMDSRVVLDEMGADKLLGKGDMLFLVPGQNSLVRAQCTFVDSSEIAKVVQHLETDEPCFSAELLQLQSPNGGGANSVEQMRQRDPLYEQAIEIVIREGRGSVSLLQRSLGIGYGRSARMIDWMAEDGIVGAYNGSNAREVNYTLEEWEAIKQGQEPARA
ncbi:MAG TPA: DNA translocase FtsK 4TM domain-containing protein [Gemmataceae bacterium]|nr:DNA translocase FtsK 4TM domain-containing protein [Gemmataceae bacterium]